jgi:hypothetical protein
MTPTILDNPIRKGLAMLDFLSKSDYQDSVVDLAWLAEPLPGMRDSAVIKLHCSCIDSN